MKILVIGSGGREHALAWKLAQSQRVTHVYVAPGNGGTALDTQLENVPITDIAQLVGFAQTQGIALTVVGPEAPLAAGVVDAFRTAGLRIFGTTQAAQSIEWLTDNGSAYIDHRTRSFARELGLEPLTTPVRSPQSNGMAESFVKTMKHNYVAYMDKSDAPTALSRLAIAFEHYNERHPHKALKYRSPREFRRNAVSST